MISRLYRRDAIELAGIDRTGRDSLRVSENDGIACGQGNTGLYLVAHNECQSRKRNATEVAIISRILQSASSQPANTIGIVTPHRAQRALLRATIGNNPLVDVVDTVERLQGGERPTIIVSATASDHTSISKSAEFILNLNRSNVAFSRAMDRLIVICSETLLDHIPAELDQVRIGPFVEKPPGDLLELGRH